MTPADKFHFDKVAALVKSAKPLDNDVNGNPRYYWSCVSFCDETGAMYRPKYVNMYRGKKFGAGWVIQSYYLTDDVRRMVEEQYGVKFVD